MKFILLSGLSLLLAFSGNSQREIEYLEYDLDNGIHVILHEEHATPIVAVSVCFSSLFRFCVVVAFSPAMALVS